MMKCLKLDNIFHKTYKDLIIISRRQPVDSFQDIFLLLKQDLHDTVTPAVY